MEIILDGNKILNKDILYKSLKKQINLEEFTGNNLDALWDVLAYNNDVTTIIIGNLELLELNLGSYCEKLLKLFADVQTTNENVTIIKTNIRKVKSV